MKNFKDIIIEKLQINPNKEYSDTSLFDQGWDFTSVNSVYSDIYQADDFLQSDIDLFKMMNYQVNYNVKQERVVIYDKIYNALKRRKYIKHLGMIIRSQNSFEDAVDIVNSFLKNTATCKFDVSKSGKHVVFKIIDSYRIAAIVMTFTKI